MRVSCVSPFESHTADDDDHHQHQRIEQLLSPLECLFFLMPVINSSLIRDNIQRLESLLFWMKVNVSFILAIDIQRIAVFPQCCLLMLYPFSCLPLSSHVSLSCLLCHLLELLPPLHSPVSSSWDDDDDGLLFLLPKGSIEETLLSRLSEECVLQRDNLYLLIPRGMHYFPSWLTLSFTSFSRSFIISEFSFIKTLNVFPVCLPSSLSFDKHLLSLSSPSLPFLWDTFSTTFLLFLDWDPHKRSSLTGMWYHWKCCFKCCFKKWWWMKRHTRQKMRGFPFISKLMLSVCHQEETR